MDHDSLYETDICAWAEQQAAVLRGLASRMDLPNALDVANVAEEIEDVGSSQLNAVVSFLRLILSHAILIAADADAKSVPHWTREAATFHASLLQRYQPGMRQRIDMASVWRRAVREACDHLETYHRDTGMVDADAVFARLSGPCPFGVDDICQEGFRFRVGVDHVRGMLTDGHAT